MSTLAESIHSPRRKILFFFSLIVLVGLSRHLPLEFSQFHNFSPVLAIFLISGSHLKGSWSWMAPVTAVIASDLILSSNYDQALLEPFMLATLAAYALVFLLGKGIGSKSDFLIVSLGGLGSALLFHLVTCSFAWWMNPYYPKNPSGLLQAVTVGEPGFTPAYLFLRNSMLSTFFFTIVFAWIANRTLPKKESAQSRLNSQTA